MFERDEDGRYWDTATIHDAAGQLRHFTRKVHIPSGEGYHETDYFAGADQFRCMISADVKLAAPTCYDQWFPELARIYALEGAELIYYPTAIGSEPTAEDFDSADAWQTVMRGHAVANGLFIAACNRIGRENAVTFYGSSFICDPLGRVLAQASRDRDEVVHGAAARRRPRAVSGALSRCCISGARSITAACCKALRKSRHRAGKMILGKRQAIDMSRMEFFIVDVFTVGRKYTGNQLAVYLGNPGRADAAAGEGDQLFRNDLRHLGSARERRLQRAHLHARGRSGFRRASGAGHGIRDSARIDRSSGRELTLNLPVGPIPVTFSDDGLLWMRQNPPNSVINSRGTDLAQILNVEEADIDTRFPLQEVSTGMAFVLAPMVSLEAVKRARVNLDRLRAILGAHDAIAPAIFCAETLEGENDIHVRVLDDIYGAPEDPATGSANGCIAAYIVEHGYFGSDKIAIRSEQGYQIGRPSLLHLEAERVGNEIVIRVGGRVEMVAQGTDGRR